MRFLQWALPQLHLRWPGFRKVRRQVCRRIDRRIRELGLADLDAYEDYLKAHVDEWAHLDSLCRVTISRFSRDRGVFATLADAVVPELVRGVRARGGGTLRAWSAGCASGEEPYTLAILWQTLLRPRCPGVTLEIIATDIDERVLERARQARYPGGSLRELPADLRDHVVAREGDSYVLVPVCREQVTFQARDVREAPPEGPFDLLLCRNLVFTYFDESLQSEVLRRFIDAMAPGAALVLGGHERLPAGTEGLEPWFDRQRVYRKSAGGIAGGSGPAQGTGAR